ncbi:MAG: hypothetical protein ACRC46_15225 [Thermoguttaceae bacterium]
MIRPTIMSRATTPYDLRDYSTCLRPWNWVRLRIFSGLLAYLVAGSLFAAEPDATLEPPAPYSPCRWYDNIDTAKESGRQTLQPLFIYFRDDAAWPLESTGIPVRHTTYYVNSASATPLPIAQNSGQRPVIGEAALCEQFELETLMNEEVAALLKSYTCVVISTRDPILQSPEFSAMGGRAGVAIVELENGCGTTSDRLTSAMPFVKGRAFNPKEIAVLLTLPNATLAQRSLIYAVRTHQHAPKSTEGAFHPVMERLAAEHAIYQATRRSMGHYNYGKRQAAAKNEIEGVVSTSEICAVNGFNATPLEAAIALVGQWRGSAPHWSAMKRSHTYYAYDMMESSQGHWYAVGFFATVPPQPSSETQTEKQ